MLSSCPLGFFVVLFSVLPRLDGPCIRRHCVSSSVANTWERAHPCALQSSSIRFVSTLTNRGVALGARASLRATIIIHTFESTLTKPRCGRARMRALQRYDHHPYTSNQRSQTEVWRARMRALPALTINDPYASYQRSQTEGWRWERRIPARYDHHPHTSNQRSQTEVWRAGDARAPSATIITSIRSYQRALTNEGWARKDARAPTSTWLLRGLAVDTSVCTIVALGARASLRATPRFVSVDSKCVDDDRSAQGCAAPSATPRFVSVDTKRMDHDCSAGSARILARHTSVCER